MAERKEPTVVDTGLTPDQERTYLNYVPSLFGKDLLTTGPLRAKYGYDVKPRDREHPWSKSEFETMEMHKAELKLPNSLTFAFRVYWLAQRYECDESKVLERIVECCNLGGTRYAADVFRFGTDYRFDQLPTTDERKHTGLGYSRGVAGIIKTPKDWSPKAGMTRPMRRVPEALPKLHKRYKVPVTPFRHYVQEQAPDALQRAPEIVTMAKAFLDTTRPESKEITLLWGRMIGLIFDTGLTHIATNLMTVAGKVAVARLVLVEAAKPW